MSSREDALHRLQERGKLLIQLLRRGKHAHQRDIVTWGGVRILAGVAVALVLLLAVSSLAPILPRPASVALGLVAWAVIAGLVWRHWLRPLRAIPNLAVFSRLIEERRDFRDMLRAALEFSERGAPAGGSVELAGAAVDRAYDEARTLSLTHLFRFAHKRRDVTIAAAGLAVVLLCAAIWPSMTQRTFQNFAFAYPTPASIAYGELEVVGGDTSILAGDDVVVRVRDHGPLAPEMTLRFNDTGDLWKVRQLEPETGRTPYEYSFRLENVRDKTVYRFESMERSTPDVTIEVVQRPIVNAFRLRLVSPEYTGREPVTLEDGRGDAIALLGTRIEVSGTSSQPLQQAFLVPGEDEDGAVTLPAPLPMQIDGTEFRADFTLRSDVRYHFEITDRLGHANSDPVTYKLGVIADRAPYVELRDPQADAAIPKSLQVPLAIYAADDFGISRMTLRYTRQREGEELDSSEKSLNLPLRGATATDLDGKPLGPGPAPEILKMFAWNLTDENLFPGDFISYYVEVEDNDAFSGHKTARTPTYRLRLPTLGEIYAKIQEEDDSRVTNLEEVLEKGREVSEKFEELARELKKNPELDWQKKQEIDRTLEKQRELAKKVEDIAEGMQKEVERMEEQQLVSEEIAQKMEQIRNLMQEVDNETMQKYMERLQEAMKQISPEEIQRAMEEMQMSQEEFLKRLERTKALLEQLKREQELDAMVERVAELLERQEQLTERTEKLTPDEAQSKSTEDAEKKEGQDAQEGKPPQPEKSEELARDQSDLAEDTQEVEKELDEMAKDFEQHGQEQLNEPNQETQQEKPSEEMQNASQQLQKQQPQSAQQNQQNAERRLRSLYEQLMDAQMAMAQNMMAQMAEVLSKAARQSLDVSFRQETLSRELAPLGDYEGTGDLARSQQALRQATEHIVEGLDEVAKQNIGMPTHIMDLFGTALTKMDQGVDAFEKGNGLAGRVRGEEAYAELNKAVIELNRSARSCMSGCSGSGMGMGSSQQRMGQTMERQQQLNDATRQFAERLPNPQSLSPEERAQLSQMLGQQRSIAGELRDIERQAAEQRDLLGRLDKMQEEMHEVIEDMESEELSEETLRAQERIVSRMLQAQRSLHKRDYNKERESQSAGEVFSQGGAPLDADEYRKKLRRDIQRALESGSPEEYQDLVRQYFRAIAESEEKGEAVTP
jgi:hypothetical protein